MDSTSATNRPPDAAIDTAARRLVAALSRLTDEPGSVLERLASELELHHRPISSGEGLSDGEKRFLVETGAFTPDELTSEVVARQVARLVRRELLRMARDQLSMVSLQELALARRESEGALRVAVAVGRLHAIEHDGTLWFPRWQFMPGVHLGSIPHLEQLLAAASALWSWESLAGFMQTRQEDLQAYGRTTPLDWLLDGGDIEAVLQVIDDCTHT